MVRAKKILLVDDDRAIRQTLSYEMRKQNYRVEQVEDGEKALDLARQAQAGEDPLDLLVVDLILPRMSGIDLVKKLREEGNPTPAIFISAYGTEDKVQEMRGIEGVAGFLVKPFSSGQLLQLVNKLLQPATGQQARPLQSPIINPRPRPQLKPRVEPQQRPAEVTTRPAPPQIRPEFDREVQLQTLQFISRFSDDLNSMLNDPELTLPVLPGTARQLRRVMASKNYNFDSVAEIMQQDAAVSARILQVANSPIYAGLERIRNLTDAVGRLGLDEVCNITQAVLVKNLFDSENTHLKRIMEKLWLHSISTAYANQMVAMRLSIADSRDYFMMGLLHDIGKLLILLLVEKGERNGMWKEDEIVPEIIYPFFAMRHHDLGYRLLEAWQYPRSFMDVVRLHNDEQNITKHPEHVIITYFANLMTRKIGYSLREYEGDPLNNKALKAALNMDQETAGIIENEIRDVSDRIYRSALAE